MLEMMLFVAVILLVCSLLKKVSGRIGIPSLLLFIVLGMLMGSDGIFKVAFDDFAFAQVISTVALVVIMFSGGFETNIKASKPVAAKAIVLSSLGTVLTAVFVGLFCYIVLGMGLLEGMLCGSVLSSTDAASVFSILRSKKLALKENTAPLLEMESGSNDPFANMLTIVVLTAMGSGIRFGEVGILLFKQLTIGLVFGFGVGFLIRSIIKTIRLDTTGIEAVFISAAVFASYAACSLLDGNGFLSVYIIGIILGNAHLKENKTLVPFFEGVTSIMQAILFFLLGLLSYPSRMGDVLLPGIAIMVFMLIIARPLAVFLLSLPFKQSRKQNILVSFAGLRGASSIVFAIQAFLDPASISYDIFHIVFIIVLLSISIQGTFLPMVAKKLDMIDEEGDVLKTFTDYVDEKPINYIAFTIAKEHSYCGKAIKDITLPPHTIIVNIQRNNLNIVPLGNTVLQCGDVVLLCALEKKKETELSLFEKMVDEESHLIGNSLKTIDREENGLVVLVQRGEEFIIPDGNLTLEAGDRIVINHSVVE